MIYSIHLKEVGFLLGLAMILAHAAALTPGLRLRERLPQFPRSRVAGIVLMAIATLWTLWLALVMDLGEFAGMRRMMAVGILALGILAPLCIPEFLAVRALGMLALLAAEPVLEAAFLRPEPGKLLVVILAYAWILSGLFWVGLPWILRNQIHWATASIRRFRLLALLGLAYGAAITVCAAFFW